MVLVLWEILALVSVAIVRIARTNMLALLLLRGRNLKANQLGTGRSNSTNGA